MTDAAASPQPAAIASLTDKRGRPDRLNNRGDAGARGTFAAIDLGTNNCRLLIAKPDSSNSSSGFVVVDAFSRIVRLGEGLASTGRLSDAAIDRAISALSVCSDKLRRRRVLLARSVATEACRQAENGTEFVARVSHETGIQLDVISAQEEARLAVLGCHSLLEPGDGPALVFDIGGGSTELVLLDTTQGTPTIVDWQSAPWGVVSLTEAVPPGTTNSAAGLQEYLCGHARKSAERVCALRRAITQRAQCAAIGHVRHGDDIGERAA